MRYEHKELHGEPYRDVRKGSDARTGISLNDLADAGREGWRVAHIERANGQITYVLFERAKADEAFPLTMGMVFG